MATTTNEFTTAMHSLHEDPATRPVARHDLLEKAGRVCGKREGQATHVQMLPGRDEESQVVQLMDDKQELHTAHHWRSVHQGTSRSKCLQGKEIRAAQLLATAPRPTGCIQTWAAQAV
mmetsp:Transcript_101455/g.295631  ORF Transcript_101455/g.295631 Transcript_101455/m.295631 type:complete len:118 (+) Transcript_101455:266-619(+)